ncbi:MAG TPA: glycoside hydrolase family 3 C-terminal domain-containing protein [Terriglobia bacterium]|nr:glycoside hydrolase family 3 C-terminal domain-containing protein [Terriglobia bacterium]
MEKSFTYRTLLKRSMFLLIVWVLLTGNPFAVAQEWTDHAPAPAPKGPWSDKSLSPDQRADLLIQQMTLEEKLSLVHGAEGGESLKKWLGGAGYVPGVPRLGIPDLQMSDGRSGVANIGRTGRYATALPSALANAASWDLQASYDFGALLGKEIRDLGFNVSLGGTANIIREPRNGRNFECLGEDPLLIGKMLGSELKGTQAQGVIGNINRYAVNDQETGRFVMNVKVDKRAMQETDLLAFHIAIQESNVGTVMCAYNRLNGLYTCEDPYLLTDVLKKSWNYQGWVMTDWGAAHSTLPSARAGLDQEMPSGTYFGDALKAAVQKGNFPMARLNDMVHRILRTEIALGVLDNPPVLRPVNPFTGAEVAQRSAELGIVLLKNANGQLPLQASSIKSLAIIGEHADAGVLSGSGSDQVNPAEGNAVPGNPYGWHPSSPLKVMRARLPNAQVTFDDGTDIPRAAKVAAGVEVAILFVHQHASEGHDVRSLSLPHDQDKMIAAVAAANPHCIVVLENGGPVAMPWIDQISAILEAWYPGIRGAEALANIIFGDVNPSGKLPVTFPKSEADLPHPTLAGMQYVPASEHDPGNVHFPPFDVNYDEGLKVGYKWYETEGKEPLFPFGFGLSYTTYSYSNLSAKAENGLRVTFSVTNTGQRAGAEIAQVYALLPASAGEPFKRLIGWEKIPLAEGEAKTVTVTVDPQYLSIFDVEKNTWEIVPGDYKVYVGGSSRSTPLSTTVQIAGGH